MKELMNRVFVVEETEFKKKLSLPEGDIVNIELTAAGIQIALVGEKQ